MSEPEHPLASDRPALLTRRTTTVMAISAGLAVANVYAAHPLLDLIGRSLAFHPATIGLAVTLTQIGYVAGLIILVPLGDVFDRRWLIVSQSGFSVLALVAAALAPTPALLLAALAAAGMFAVTVQTLVAYAGALASPQERGAAVGTVTSGIVIGILAARVVSGSVGDLMGWRAVYVLAAVAGMIAMLVLCRMLPADCRPPAKEQYGALLTAMPRLLARDSVLRLRAAYAFVIFAAFSTFWTALVIPLTDARVGLSHTQVGLFGLIGIAGAIGARGAGRFADRGYERSVTGGALLILCLSWALIAMLPWSLWSLAAGIVLLDLAVQAIHVTNQTLILGRHPDAAGRVIAAYMVFYSLGSATGAAVTTFMYSLWGWNGVCAIGFAISASGLIVWVVQAGKTSSDHLSGVMER